MTILSANAFATPDAMVPTPVFDTNLTAISASLFAFFKSWINCAKSSIEYISWCGGGEMRPIPGVDPLVSAIHGYTLEPGNWPPSPGLAPCATLICISFACCK